MVEWEKLHWSGRTDPAAGRKPKLKPNLFARLARASAANAAAVLGFFIVASVLAAAVSVLYLSVNPDVLPSVTLDAQTAAAQTAFDGRFPGIEQSFTAVIAGEESAPPKAAALALAQTLSGRPDLFASAFVPGAGAFYDRFGLLFHPTEDIARRVTLVENMQALFRALAAAPNVQGLAVLVGEIGKAVDQGRSPPGLSGFLKAVSATVEAEVQGVPAPLDWIALAGLAPDIESRRWFVIAAPMAGKEREAAAFARAAAQPLAGVTWLWPRRALGQEVHPVRDFVVPGGLAAVTVLTLLGAGLGAFRYAMPVAAATLATICLSAAAAVSINRHLDGATWAFAAAVAAAALVLSIAYVIGHARERQRGYRTRQAVMLAGQRQGPMLVAIAAVFLAFWVTWFLRRMPSLVEFSAIAVAGTVIALLVTLLIVPAVLAIVDHEGAEDGPHWADEVLDAPPTTASRSMIHLAGVTTLAAGVFCAVFLPSVKFGERLHPLDPPAILDSPDGRGAIHVLVPPDEAARPAISALSALPETGSVRWIEQFLPVEVETKLLYLKQLDGLFPDAVPPPAPADQQLIAPAFAQLQTGLRQIADGPSADEDLRQAAHRMRRAVGLFIEPEPPSPGRVLALEDALFARLGHLPRIADALVRLRPPALTDLDPQLRQRFVADDGWWRVEVMPKPGVGTLSFAAAVRKAAPAAAGEPIVALSRNEIVHHEAALAFAAAMAAAAVLSLAALRDPARWLMALPAAAVAATLAAAAVTLLGIAINSAMLAGGSLAAALSSACSMLYADAIKGSQQGRGAALRAAVLPPVVMLGATLPLMLSAQDNVAEFGSVLSLFLSAIVLTNAVLLPAMSQWLRQLRML